MDEKGIGSWKQKLPSVPLSTSTVLKILATVTSTMKVVPIAENSGSLSSG